MHPRRGGRPTLCRELPRLPRHPSPAISTALPSPRLRGRRLIVPPFRLEAHGQTYTSRAELRIEVATLRPGRYRVLAVQNFHVEDRSADLSDAVAGVFLARRDDQGRWQEPEAFPIECRLLAVLGELEVGARVTFEQPRAPALSA